MKMLLAIGGAVGLLAPSALAVNPTIVVGNHVLIPLPGQSFTISVSGGTAVSGVNFNAEVANGGTASGGTPGPAITGVDLLSGTIFGTNNQGQQNATTNNPQYFSCLTIASTGTVAASGTLATMTFDPSNFIGGIYSLKLGGLTNGNFSGDTDFTVAPDYSPIPATITNGNIIVTFPGDTNLDGVVNAADAVTFARNYGKLSGATWAMGDFNGDGKIDITDANLLKQYYDRSVNINPAVPSFESAVSSAAVPEPATLGVVGIGVAGICLRRRRTS